MTFLPVTQTVKPEWRTDTVLQLCMSMRETGDYSAAPILADALQDAGCDHELLLIQLRHRDDMPGIEYVVACVYNDDAFEAGRALDDFAVSVGYTYEQVVNAGRNYVRTGDQFCVDENWDATNAMCDNATRKAYWTAMRIVTGLSPRYNSDPFTCPC